MRRFHLAFTMLATSLVAGCAGPQHRTEPAPVAMTKPVPPPRQAPPADPRRERLQELLQAAPELDPGVLALALQSRDCAVRAGEVDGDSRLAVIDYSQPSTRKRLWVLDIANAALLFHDYVTHGQGSGGNVATRFSNVEGSFATSLGLYRTAETYTGGNGYSLRMDGLDPGFNDAARQRAIVMHGAWYANPDLIRSQGRLGRSQGCPALREGVAKVVIDTMKQRQLLFAYADDADFLRRGRSFACDGRSARQILDGGRALARAGGGIDARAVAAG